MGNLKKLQQATFLDGFKLEGTVYETSPFYSYINIERFNPAACELDGQVNNEVHESFEFVVFEHDVDNYIEFFKNVKRDIKRAKEDQAVPTYVSAYDEEYEGDE